MLAGGTWLLVAQTEVDIDTSINNHNNITILWELWELSIMHTIKPHPIPCNYNIYLMKGQHSPVFMGGILLLIISKLISNATKPNHARLPSSTPQISHFPSFLFLHNIYF